MYILSKGGESQMNHFLTIWTKPDATLRDMIDEKSIGYGILVVMLSGLGSSVFVFADNGVMEGFSLPAILFISIVLTMIGSIPFYFFNAGVYLLIGKMLGGRGRYKQICMATASGSLPMIGLWPVSILALVLYGKSLYAEVLNPFAVTNMSGVFYIFYMLITLGLSIYGIVILSKGLGYAHQFSALRGFGAIMIYAGIMFVIIFVVAIVALVIGVSILTM